MQKKKVKSIESRSVKYGYLFTAPFIIGSVFFVIFPIILSVAFSFSNVSNDASGYTMEFSKLENYRYMILSDADYNKTVFNTLKGIIIDVPVVTIFSFFIASMLNQEFKGRGIARTVLFLPLIVSSPAVMQLLVSDTVSSEMSNSAAEVTSSVDFSAALTAYLNEIDIGFEFTQLLSSTVNNISSVLAMSAIPIIIFLAALQSVSPSIYEASYVEGATKWEVFWKISLPMISPMILVVIIYTMIDSFSSSNNAVIKTIHNLCFTGNINLGRGCAAAWIYLVITLTFTAFVYLVVNKFVFYYDD